VTAMNIRFGSGVCVAMLALIAGCSPKLKDNAPANRQVAASEMPTSFVDAAGKSIDLKDYRGRAVVLVVVRGIPESPGGVICPYCLAQAGSLAAKYEEFKSRGAGSAVLTEWRLVCSARTALSARSPRSHLTRRQRPARAWCLIFRWKFKELGTGGTCGSTTNMSAASAPLTQRPAASSSARMAGPFASSGSSWRGSGRLTESIH
jgi:hypothetical protein